MRYSQPVYLQSVVPGVYDPNTGNYGKETITERLVYGSVVENTAEKSKVLYGQITQGTLTAHFLNELPVFDFVRIGENRYRADAITRAGAKTILTLSRIAQ